MASIHSYLLSHLCRRLGSSAAAQKSLFLFCSVAKKRSRRNEKSRDFHELPLLTSNPSRRCQRASALLYSHLSSLAPLLKRIESLRKATRKLKLSLNWSCLTKFVQLFAFRFERPGEECEADGSSLSLSDVTRRRLHPTRRALPETQARWLVETPPSEIPRKKSNESHQLTNVFDFATTSANGVT